MMNKSTTGASSKLDTTKKSRNRDRVPTPQSIHVRRDGEVDKTHCINEAGCYKSSLALILTGCIICGLLIEYALITVSVITSSMSTLCISYPINV